MIAAVLVCFLVGIILGLPLVLTFIGATVAPGFINPEFTANIQFVLRGIIGGGDNTGILAAPLFILSGIIMARGGLSEKIFNVFALSLIHILLTAPDDFSAVREALEQAGVPMVEAEVTMLPQTWVELSDETDIKMMGRILDLLDEDDDVQNVYHNWDE